MASVFVCCGDIVTLQTFRGGAGLDSMHAASPSLRGRSRERDRLRGGERQRGRELDL